MHSFILLACSLAALLVAMTGWSRIRKPDIFLPATLIGLFGGVTNVWATFYIQNTSPGPLSYLLVVGMLFLFIASGLYLAEKGGLPGLCPKVENRLLLGGLGTGVGVLVGLTTWRIALLGAPGLPAFMTNLKTGPNSGLYTALLVIQSGLVEEPMYRLFLISGIVELLSLTGVSRNSRVILALMVSSVAFGLIPTHNFAVTAVVGLLFGSMYLKAGLAPVMLAHMAANAVALPLLLGWW
jgi:hypothetical protein